MDLGEIRTSLSRRWNDANAVLPVMKAVTEAGINSARTLSRCDSADVTGGGTITKSPGSSRMW